MGQSLPQDPNQTIRKSLDAGLGVVVIGRNEGARLERCLSSLPSTCITVYVDSGSTDGSVRLARDIGVHVVELDMRAPFTAARARNAGFSRLVEINSTIEFVQFVDGDCELATEWLEIAASFLSSHTTTAAVSGRLRERHPDKSIYNQLCDWEWDGQPGTVNTFGGIVMLRTSALKAVHGFRDEIIAGEEPELAVRLRQAGYQIWRIEAEMALHDAAMLHFWQWWYRNVRSGYAFATGAYIHGMSSDRHWVWESSRAWIWGILIPLICIAISIRLGWWGLLIWLIFPLQFFRIAFKTAGSAYNRGIRSFFQLLGRFPEALGQLKFLRDSLMRRRSSLIEHK